MGLFALIETAFEFAVLIGALFIYINLKDEIKKNKQILLFYSDFRYKS